MNIKFISLSAAVFSLIAQDKLIDIGTHKMHLHEMGSTGPTVVFDACLGNNFLEWILVQPEVAHFAHTVSYDRSGLGWSEKSTLPRTSECIAQELRALLRAAEIQPPYLLVGHSSGGNNMRMFANLYPEEVVGLVLIDSCHPHQRIEWKKLETLIQPPHVNTPAATNPLSWLPAEARATGGQEHTLLDESFMQITTSTNRLTDKPLTVISRDTKVLDNAPVERKPFELAWHNAWMEFQKELTVLSTKGKQIIAAGCGHMIQRECPDIIIQAIQEMVQEYRENLQN